MTVLHLGSRTLTSAVHTATSTTTPDTTVRACVGEDPERFFPRHESPSALHPSIEELDALTVCARCPLAERAACLTEQLAAGRYHQFGVAGGATAAQRRALLRASTGNRVAAQVDRQMTDAPASAVALSMAG